MSAEHSPDLCKCCNHFAQKGEPEDGCFRCGWVDDGHSEEDADQAIGGPNWNLSLSQARYNLSRIGAISWAFLDPFEESETFAESEVPPTWSIPPRLSRVDKSYQIGNLALSFVKAAKVDDYWDEVVSALINLGFTFDRLVETKSDAVDWMSWHTPRAIEEYEDRLPHFREESRVILGAVFRLPDSNQPSLMRVENHYRRSSETELPVISIRLPEDFFFDNVAKQQTLFRALIEDLQPILGQSFSPLQSNVGRQALKGHMLSGQTLYLSNEIQTPETRSFLISPPEGFTSEVFSDGSLFIRTAGRPYMIQGKMYQDLVQTLSYPE